MKSVSFSVVHTIRHVADSTACDAVAAPRPAADSSSTHAAISAAAAALVDSPRSVVATTSSRRCTTCCVDTLPAEELPVAAWGLSRERGTPAWWTCDERSAPAWTLGGAAPRPLQSLSSCNRPEVRCRARPAGQTAGTRAGAAAATRMFGSGQGRACAAATHAGGAVPRCDGRCCSCCRGPCTCADAMPASLLASARSERATARKRGAARGRGSKALQKGGRLPVVGLRSCPLRRSRPMRAAYRSACDVDA
eukprot:366197-Chlamydomonas_euryale.AAC.22